MKFVEVEPDHTTVWETKTEGDEVVEIKTDYFVAKRVESDLWEFQVIYTSGLKKKKFKLNFCDLDMAMKLLQVWQHMEPSRFTPDQTFGKIEKI